MKPHLINLILLVLFCYGAVADDESGLQIAIAGDIAGEFGVAAGHGANNRLDPRGVEFLFYAPVDHLFDARASVAAHIDSSSPTVALHEAFFGSSKLIPRSRFRIGQFFLGIGRLNQFHAHDWPFISAPLIHRMIFDGRTTINAEGAIDTGLEYSWLFPFEHFLELTVGLTNGWTFGHSHALGTLPKVPSHYGRLATYLDLPGRGGVQIGANYLGRTDASNTQTSIYGLDLTAKWRRNKVLSFLLQSEAWYQTEGATQYLGFYLFPQKSLSDTLLLGFRYDFFTEPTKQTAGQYRPNWKMNFVPMLTYQASHFSTLRMAYNIKPTFASGDPTTIQHFFELQGIFILGAHPAHSF